MALRCVLCGRLSPDRSARCECGYDFKTGELDESVALERSLQRKRAAGSHFGRGIVLLALIPVATVLFGALCVVFDTVAPAIIGALVDFLLAAGGVMSLGAGVASRVGARRELQTVRERRQLPEARVVPPGD